VRPAHGISGSLASIPAKLAGAQNYMGMYIRFYEAKENPEIQANGDGFYLKKAMIWSLMEGTKTERNPCLKLFFIELLNSAEILERKCCVF